LGFDLGRLGVAVPITDCVIAAVELIGGLVLTLYAHFEELARMAYLELVRS
jgi:hypothetical protein